MEKYPFELGTKPGGHIYGCHVFFRGGFTCLKCEANASHVPGIHVHVCQNTVVPCWCFVPFCDISVCRRMGDTQIYDSVLFWWERAEKPWNLGATLLGGKTWGHCGIWNQPLGCFTAVSMLVVSFYYWNPTPQLSSIKQQISQIYSPEKQTKNQTNKTASIKVMKMAWQAGIYLKPIKSNHWHICFCSVSKRPDEARMIFPSG